MKKEELYKQGFKDLTHEEGAKLDGKLIEVYAHYQLDWFNTSIHRYYKVFLSEDKGVLLMKPRARSRAIYLSTLDKPIYKVVDKVPKVINNPA